MTSTKTHVTKIGTVVVPVADQDREIDFYVEKLGFEKRADVPFGNGYRWVEVAPGDAVTTIALAPLPRAGPRATARRELACRPKTSTRSTPSCGPLASMSMRRSAAWATRCHRCSGCGTRRATA
jgi:hypothetical protein